MNPLPDATNKQVRLIPSHLYHSMTLGVIHLPENNFVPYHLALSPSQSRSASLCPDLCLQVSQRRARVRLHNRTMVKISALLSFSERLRTPEDGWRPNQSAAVPLVDSRPLPTRVDAPFRNARSMQYQVGQACPRLLLLLQGSAREDSHLPNDLNNLMFLGLLAQVPRIHGALPQCPTSPDNQWCRLAMKVEGHLYERPSLQT